MFMLAWILLLLIVVGFLEFWAEVLFRPHSIEVSVVFLGWNFTQISWNFVDAISWSQQN